MVNILEEHHVILTQALGYACCMEDCNVLKNYTDRILTLRILDQVQGRGYNTMSGLPYHMHFKKYIKSFKFM